MAEIEPTFVHADTWPEISIYEVTTGLFGLNDILIYSNPLFSEGCQIWIPF